MASRTAKMGRLMPGSYPTRNRSGSIVGARIDICAGDGGDGWIADWRVSGGINA